MLSSLVLLSLLTSSDRLLVVTRHATDISPRQQLLFDTALSAEIAKFPDLELVTPRAEDADDSTVCTNDDCATRLAKRFNVQYLLHVNVNRVGDADVLSMRMLRLIDGEVVGQSLRSGASQGILAEIGPATGEAFAPRLRRPDSAQGVNVTYASRWSPKPLHKAVFATGAAVTVATLATAVAFRVVSENAQADYHALVTQSLAMPVDGRSLVAMGQRAESAYAYSLVFFGTAAGFGALTILSAFFTDWGNDQVSLAISPSGASVFGRF